uniref:Uncharacterized protein n=1 Tax=Arion vulgaris TaxID=1028688 RepID=A0A0B7BPV1_9EUPU
MPTGINKSFLVCIRLDKEWRQDNPMVVEAEVQALISENSSGKDVIILYRWFSDLTCVELTGFHCSSLRGCCQGRKWWFCCDHEQSHYGNLAAKEY